MSLQPHITRKEGGKEDIHMHSMLALQEPSGKERQTKVSASFIRDEPEVPGFHIIQK